MEILQLPKKTQACRYTVHTVRKLNELLKYCRAHNQNAITNLKSLKEIGKINRFNKASKMFIKEKLAFYSHAFDLQCTQYLWRIESQNERICGATEKLKTKRN